MMNFFINIVIALVVLGLSFSDVYKRYQKGRAKEEGRSQKTPFKSMSNTINSYDSRKKNAPETPSLTQSIEEFVNAFTDIYKKIKSELRKDRRVEQKKATKEHNRYAPLVNEYEKPSLKKEQETLVNQNIRNKRNRYESKNDKYSTIASLIKSIEESDLANDLAIAKDLRQSELQEVESPLVNLLYPEEAKKAFMYSIIFERKY